jgi:hypothetical protein
MIQHLTRTEASGMQEQFHRPLQNGARIYSLICKITYLIAA